ncbi:cell division protein ZapD [Thaumasiovibrio subtropicus]|uniref:cell division protein ZapD n=1 Tax=Thaumasiovibrio subtropicus TaxID=1891207 RepID=UPI000B362FFC|nr:cell division protein ZapD [Thaumasiovibrio subtropicus]
MHHQESLTTHSSTSVRYEHPLNERVRTYLRFEALFRQMHHNAKMGDQWQHQLFFRAIFDTLELLDQIQLKAELVKDLDKQRIKLKQWLNIENVDQNTLLKLLDELEKRHHELLSAPRLGQGLREDRFLCSIRQRFSIPGGTCNFDLPSLHHWLHLSEEEKSADITRWMEQVEHASAALSLWLRLIRDSGHYIEQQATQGFFQDDAPDAELIRIAIETQHGVYPMISGHRSRFAIRFLPFSEEGEIPEKLAFSLARC